MYQINILIYCHQVFIPEASDLKQQAANKTIRRRALSDENGQESLNLTSKESDGTPAEQNAE